MRLLSKKLLLVVLFFSIKSINAQNVEFKSLIDDFSKNLKEVKTSKSNFSQKISSDKNNQIMVYYEVSEKNVKGKKTNSNYEFNFADIDSSKVKYQVFRDLIKVELPVKEGRKYIKKSVDNKKSIYNNKCYLYAVDVDNARKLVEIVQNLIPLSKNITKKRLSLTGYEDRLSWLQSSIKNINYPTKKLIQQFTVDSTYIGNVYYSSILESAGAAAVKKIYNFNLSTIDTSSIKLSNKGDNFKLSFKTKNNQKAIKYIEDGAIKSFTNKLEILCENIENGRELKQVFTNIIPLSEERFKRNSPAINTVKQGIEEINKKVQKFNDFKQEFEGECLVAFHQTNKEGRKVRNTLAFNLTDINSKSLELKIKDRTVYLAGTTINKNNFIKHTKNDTPLNYVNQIKLYFDSVEDAILSKEILKKVVGLCNQGVKKTNFSLQNVEKAVHSVELAGVVFEQSVKEISDNLLKFTSKKKTSQKAEESVQEFRITDVNPDSVNMKVQGNKVIVDFYTKQKEKIIKTYFNGEVKAYTNKVTILCDSVENAREIAENFRNVTK